MSINVSFRLLKAFLTLVEQKNFTRAAERCHVSQSTLSGMIQRLEEDVGTRLFDRDTRNVVLTPEGGLFAEAARHLVDEIERTFSNLDDLVAKKKGRVGIAALPSISGDWLPPVIGEFRSLYSGIAVEVFDVLSDTCMQLLNSGDADIAIAAPNTPLDEYCSEHFHTDRFYLVCRRDHRVARLESVSLDDLDGCDFIRLSRQTSVHQHVVNAVGATGVTTSTFQVNYLSTVAGLIRHGLGVSLLPELALTQFRDPELVAVPLAPPGISRPIHVLWRKDRPLSIAAGAMLELIRQRKGSAGQA